MGTALNPVQSSRAVITVRPPDHSRSHAYSTGSARSAAATYELHTFTIMGVGDITVHFDEFQTDEWSIRYWFEQLGVTR